MLFFCDACHVKALTYMMHFFSFSAIIVSLIKPNVDGARGRPKSSSTASTSVNEVDPLIPPFSGDAVSLYF